MNVYAQIAATILSFAASEVKNTAKALLSSLQTALPEDKLEAFFTQLNARRTGLLYEIGKDKLSSTFGHSNTGAGTAGVVGEAAQAAGMSPHYVHVARSVAFRTFGNGKRAAQEDAKAAQYPKDKGKDTDGASDSSVYVIGAAILAVLLLSRS